MQVWKIIFLSKWVMCSFQPLIFQGCSVAKERVENIHIWKSLTLQAFDSIWTSTHCPALSRSQRGDYYMAPTQRKCTLGFFSGKCLQNHAIHICKFALFGISPQNGVDIQWSLDPKKTAGKIGKQAWGTRYQRSQNSQLLPEVQRLQHLPECWSPPFRTKRPGQKKRSDAWVIQWGPTEVIEILGIFVEALWGLFMRMQKWWRDQQKHMKFVRITLYKLT